MDIHLPHRWTDVLKRVFDPPPAHYSSSTIRDRVIRSGEDVTLISVSPSLLPPDVTTRVSRIRIEIGYASIFGETWMQVTTLNGEDSELRDHVHLNPQRGRLPEF